MPRVIVINTVDASHLDKDLYCEDVFGQLFKMYHTCQVNMTKIDEEFWKF